MENKIFPSKNKSTMPCERQQVTSIYTELPQMEEVRTIVNVGQMQDGFFVSMQPGNGNNVYFAGISYGSSVISRMIGFNQSEIIELFTRAVNNRTRQRNYFRLQNSMLEGLISEDEFYKTIEENEDDYVVEELEEPSKERLLHAMYLSKCIKDVNNSEDLSTLFSFGSETTDNELKKIEADGCL